MLRNPNEVLFSRNKHILIKNCQATLSLTFSQSFFEQNVSYSNNYCDFQRFWTYVLIKSNFNSYVTLSLTFPQSFFEQNVSVQLKLLRFSEIFDISKYSQKCGTFSQKCGNAGNKPKCGISRTIAGRLTPMPD